MEITGSPNLPTRRLRRPKKVAAQAEIAIPLNRTPSRGAWEICLQEIMKHYLYMRNQIPALYDDMYWQVNVSHLGKFLCSSILLLAKLDAYMIATPNLQ